MPSEAAYRDVVVLICERLNSSFLSHMPRFVEWCKYLTGNGKFITDETRRYHLLRTLDQVRC